KRPVTRCGPLFFAAPFNKAASSRKGTAVGPGGIGKVNDAAVETCSKKGHLSMLAKRAGQPPPSSSIEQYPITY
ncbi:hypothetical protein VSU19_07755, partial [Verrucomicrobiales bacterium BCK34]|nr:hypothetical protein [Verrucomicrobiales bacterium BCK34]